MRLRARLMLAALEDGCTTREQMYAHAGRYFMTNNAAAELRAVGIGVVCDRGDGSYRLLDEGGGDVRGHEPAPLVEQEGGQFALEVAA